MTSIRNESTFALKAGVALLPMLLGLALTPAHAQDEPANSSTQPTGAGPQTEAEVSPGQDPVAEEADDSEVVVTARRRVERLQDVPQTVNAVQSEDFSNYNILEIGDVDKLVSGLQINGDNISMRGVTYITIANTPVPTVATYINDVPIPAVDFNIASFDIGQLEVLRGPQGTVRGIASPSGAMTATTRRADLMEVGGYATGSAGSLHNFNFQAAVGVPIIKDVLGIRVAGVYNKGDANGVRSVFNSKRPFDDAQGVRASLRFEPTDNIQANVMYQRVQTRTRSYGTAVFGEGAPGGVNPNAPAGYNGPVLTIDDEMAVTEERSNVKNTTENLLGNIGWSFAGQRLSYIGSYQQSTTLTTFSPADVGNSLIGYEIPGPFQDSPRKIYTNELRLSSEKRIADIFDYVVGAFHQEDKSRVTAGGGAAAILAGAFGSPLEVDRPIAPNQRYVIFATVDLPRRVEETSFFANLTAHVGERLEISGGARHIHFENLRDLTINVDPAFIAFAVSPTICSSFNGEYGATYPGVCDFPTPAMSTVVAKDNVVKDNTWIYDASVSYRFTPELMAYAHFGTSWRAGGFGVGLNNGRNDPVLNRLIFQDPEESKSYEAGLKWSFLNRRGRINLSYYHQDYENFIFTVPGAIRYLSYTSATATPTVGANPNISVNAPAKVDGIDIDAAVQVTPRWSVAGNFSWSNGKVTGQLPCNDGDFDGVPDTIRPTPGDFIANGVFIATCDLEAGASSAPKWNVRAQTEYHMPVTDRIEGFIRGLFAYQPKNPNASQTYTIPAYGLLDLFLGVRSADGRWEVNAYGKNILNTREVVALGAGEIIPPLNLRERFGDTGYTTFALSPRREFGINARISFGSD
jgi:iron complex outermembrane receptor protein